jgi:hypothetical protein
LTHGLQIIQIFIGEAEDLGQGAELRLAGRT